MNEERKTDYGPCPECGGANVRVVFDDETLGESGPLTLVCDDCPHEAYVPAEARSRTRILALREIVRDHQAARIDGYIVDATTANMLVSVYDALKPENQERFGKVPLLKLVDLGWSAVK